MLPGQGTRMNVQHHPLAVSFQCVMLDSDHHRVQPSPLLSVEIGELLVDDGAIDSNDLQKALDIQNKRVLSAHLKKEKVQVLLQAA